MPAEGVPARAHDEILSYEELAAFARVAAGCGISKVRITGGEPLVRQGCADFVGMLGRTSGIHDISLTTNGVLLPRYAADLRRAGLRRVNISLDSLDAERFARISRGGRLADALAGLDAAFAAGFAPVKVNALLLDGVEDELDAFVALTREREVHVRFIEFMPLDRRLGGDRATSCRLPRSCSSSRSVTSWCRTRARTVTARRSTGRRPGRCGTIGFIAGVSEHFCESCNRLRLTADGRLRTCLFSGDEVDIRPLIARPEELREAIRARCRARASTAAASSAPTSARCPRSEGEAVSELSHLDARGRARMVDVGGKDETERVARAEAHVVMAPATLAMIEDEAAPKGDVIAVARLAGIMAAKRTHELIPLCHQLNLTVGGRRHRAGRRAARPARHHRGAAARAHGRRDGGAGRRVRGGAHHLRHVQGRRPRHGGDGRAPAREERRAQRRVAARSAAQNRVEASSESHAVDGRIVSVNVAAEKGVRKEPVDVDHPGRRARRRGRRARRSLASPGEPAGQREHREDEGRRAPTVEPGAFGENITTEGLVVYELPVGARLYAGECLLEVTQIGKVCHDRCAIFHQAGDCVMPREGIFARVIEGGEILPGDGIVLLKQSLIVAAVLTVSDKGSRGERDDTSGDALEEALRALGVASVERAIVPDEREQIAAELQRWADETTVNLILTTGGTGMTTRDVTPEATLARARSSGAGLRRGDARRLGRHDAARDALACRQRHARQDADHQHAGQPAGLPRAVRDDRAGAAARGGEAARPGRRLRHARAAARARELTPAAPPGPAAVGARQGVRALPA